MRGAYRAPAPIPAWKWKIKGGVKVSAAYDAVVRAWRAGVLEDFYCGTRADDDDTVIWLIDGQEFERADTAGVLELVARKCRAAGVESLEWGPFWCGYRELVVTFAGGVVVREHYNGRERLETATRNGGPVLEAVAS